MDQCGKKVVKSKWVLRVKTNAEGEVAKYKSRVVEKSYSQVEGVKFDKNFSLTVRFERIRKMVAMGTSKNMEMHQLDVRTTFLYAPLEEEVNMQQPEGTMQLGDEGKMLRLLKCLYELKQAPRPFTTFTSTLF